ncbi:MAG TPA: GNAT family N-acetyltransferase [Candidatus Aquilonibacter sp.]
MSYIETPRLIVRTWLFPADLTAAQALFTDPDVQRWYVRNALTPQDVGAYVRALAGSEERDGFGIWPVVAKESREVVGACGLAYVPDRSFVEVAWAFVPAARGQGYAREAAAAVLTWAREHVPGAAIYALVDLDNAASVALVNRLQMHFDGVVRLYRRDLLRYRVA